MTWVRANLQVRRMWWSSVLPNFPSLFYVMECRCRAHLEMKYTVWDNLQSSCGSHRGPRSKQAVFKLFTDEANINLVHSSAAFCHQVNNSVPVNTKQMSLKTDWHSDRTQVSLTLTEHLNGEDGVGENWRALMPWSSCCLGDGGSYTGRFVPMHCQCLC